MFLGNDLRGKDARYAFDLQVYNCMGWVVPSFIVLVTIIWHYQDYRDDT